MLLELAPTINGDNGSSMKEEWKRQADIHRLAISALREQDATDINVGNKTNADHIRSMTDEELAVFLEDLYSHCNGPWEILFERKFCDHCHAPEYELEDGRKLKIHECDFTGGKCPHGSDVLWWLQQPYKEDT